LTGKADPNALVDLIDASGRVLGTGAADASGNYSVQLSPAADLPNGTYSIRARAHGLVSNQGPVSGAVTIQLVTVAGDYLATGATQGALFRRTGPNSAAWFVANSSINGRSFGAGSMDVPIAADVDGDGKTDLVIFRPSTGQWFAQQSSKGYAGQLLTTVVAPAAGDIPAPADYSGIGKATLAVFRPSTGQFFVSGQSGATVVTAGKAGDIPVPANYDNTGKDEFAVYRPGAGEWFIQGPNGVHSVFFGLTGDIPVPGAYDATAANPSAEVAVFRPGTGQYLIRTAGGATRTLNFAPGDIPAPGDYEGKGVTEAAVFRPSTRQFLVVSPGQTTPHAVATLGAAGDVPVLAPYQYRALPGTVSAASTGAIHASRLDLGSTARSLSSGTTTTAAPSTASATTTPTGAGQTTVPTINLSSRLRPRQLAALRRELAMEMRLLAQAARKGFQFPG
jgi:hypothetical protein